jgi:hypothetical protein
MGYSQVKCPMDSADGFRVAACPDVVVAGHGHGTEPYAGDVEPADRNVLYDVVAHGRCI